MTWERGRREGLGEQILYVDFNKNRLVSDFKSHFFKISVGVY